MPLITEQFDVTDLTIPYVCAREYDISLRVWTYQCALQMSERLFIALSGLGTHVIYEAHVRHHKRNHNHKDGWKIMAQVQGSAIVVYAECEDPVAVLGEAATMIRREQHNGPNP